VLRVSHSVKPLLLNTNEMAKILVLGATGSQGGSVATHLSKNGYEVTGLTRDLTSKSAKLLPESGVTPVQGDLDDYASLVKAMSGVDFVIFVDVGLCCDELLGTFW
jgi:uncharacterized protein YbjT (DUF2867 family)